MGAFWVHKFSNPYISYVFRCFEFCYKKICSPGFCFIKSEVINRGILGTYMRWIGAFWVHIRIYGLRAAFWVHIFYVGILGTYWVGILGT